jgi:hypothetical protein
MDGVGSPLERDPTPTVMSLIVIPGETDQDVEAVVPGTESAR